MIDRERKRLVETLQGDSGLLLDALLARGVLTGPEYEALDALPDAERRVRRLLLLVQSKGEAACQELLRCAQRTARTPDPAWDWQHVGTGERTPKTGPSQSGGRDGGGVLICRWVCARETTEGSSEPKTFPPLSQATGSAAMTLHALVTGPLRPPAQGPHALGCPEFHTVRRLEVLRALRQCNLEAWRSLS